MSIFIPLRLKVHEVGVCYKDANRTEFDGTALFCITWMQNTDRVSVNIADFQQAVRFKIEWVILQIVSLKWSRRITMDKAVELMENAHQFQGADYKLISRYDVDGYVSIPDDHNIPANGIPF